MKKRRHPDWLKVKISGGKNYSKIKSLLRKSNLNTICEEAKCPNMAECFNRGTAVFLILGDICTRNCRYCNVKHGEPKPINPDEPKEVARSINTLGIKYAVITSVTRDDLKDGGAIFFKKTIEEIKKLNPSCKTEALIPDFQGNKKALKKVIDAKPDVVNHNIEVVKELFPTIRPEGNYYNSLKVLENIKKINPEIKSKSGLMIGLGENKKQIINTLRDLRKKNIDFLTIGQYLQPTKKHAEIKKYYTPKEFDKFKKIALNMGFEHVESGPLVRSSYRAEQALK